MTTKYAYVEYGLGTSTTDTTFSALQSEAFDAASANLNASNCYANLQAVIDYAALVDGDIVCFSSDHIETTIAHTTFTILYSLTLLGVDSTDGAVYKYGAQIDGATGLDQLKFDVAPGKTLTTIGVNINSGDDLLFIGDSARYYYDDCRLRIRTGNKLGVTLDGIHVYIKNSIITTDGVFYLPIIGGAFYHLDNVDISKVTTTDFLFELEGNGGGQALVENTDLTSCIAAGTAFIRTTTAYHDVVNVIFKRCKINTNQEVIASITSPNTYIDLYSCHNGDGYHYFESYRWEGKVLESTTVKRTGGATYDGTNGFSAEFQPNTNVVAYTQPLEIKIAEIELDLTSVNTLTFHLAMEDNTSAITASTVTNDKYFIKIVQNDATDNALGVTIDTKPADILTTPTALANAATTWTGRTATYQDEFQIAVDTVAVTGMTNGQVTAYLCVAEYVSTRAIFACPSPVVT